MIRITCDDCERSFDVDPAAAGGKVKCPHCGDVNRVPDQATPQSQRLPPDDGPEQEIRVVHPAMFRAHPFRFTLLMVLFVGGLVMAIASASEKYGPWLGWLGLMLIVIAAAWWLAWFIRAHLWVKLTISNKRTVRSEGIIRRHTSEVLHDHVRNIEIRQSVVQRLLNAGHIGISSAGQDDIEIEVHDIPKPYELKALIDEYRDM